MSQSDLLGQKGSGWWVRCGVAVKASAGDTALGCSKIRRHFGPQAQLVGRSDDLHPTRRTTNQAPQDVQNSQHRNTAQMDKELGVTSLDVRPLLGRVQHQSALQKRRDRTCEPPNLTNHVMNNRHQCATHSNHHRRTYSSVLLFL